MSLQLDSPCLDIIQGHAEASYPEECCGFLLGEMAGDATVVVRHVFPAANDAAEAERNARYRLAPRDYLAVDRFARSKGWDIVGVYHSHPDGVPAPSSIDTDEGWPGYIYVIAAVRRGAMNGMSAWVLDESGAAGGRSFRELALTSGGGARSAES